MRKHDEFFAKMNEQLDEIHADIDALQRKAEAAEGKVRQHYENELDQLRKQSKAFTSKLDELKAAGADHWEHMANEVEDVRDAYKHSYNDLRSQR